MRIGIIVPEFPSYTETFFLSQVKGLCERGHDVIVFCSHQNKDPVLEKNYELKHYSNLRIVELNIIRFGLTGLKNIVLHPLFFFGGWNREHSFRKSIYVQLCKVYLQKFNCSIYHFGYTGTAVSFLPMLGSLPGKVVVSCRGTAENVKPITDPGRIVKLFEVFKRVDSIHCVSEDLAVVIRRYGAPQEKIFINRPSIDVDYFRRRTPYPDHEVLQILTIGRLVFQKGLVTGILAIRLLVKKFPTLQWVIAGDGPDREELVFHIHLFGLEHNIVLAGRKSRMEIFEMYQQCDIFFLPSISEGIANVVLEAMSMELPVVSTDAGGIGEVIRSGKNGIACPVYDHIAMADALELFYRNREMRASMGRQARKTIEAGHNLTKYIDVYEEVYGDLVAGEGSK